MYYGQHGEDRYLESLFKGVTHGVCVDVGAYDGVSGSNTFRFERAGWRCLCVEPIPGQAARCRSIRKEVEECCVGLEDGKVVRFEVFTLNRDNQSAISGLAPDQRLVDSHRELITGREPVIVSQRTLTSLLDQRSFPRMIDFISVDTENTELDVLRSLDLMKYSVTVFCVENNFNEPHVENHLASFGYVKINRIAVNDFFARLPSFGV